MRKRSFAVVVCAAGLSGFWCDRALGNDVSAIGAGVNQYVTGTMDNSYVWYEKGFNPSAPTTGLPAAGVLASSTNSNWTFRLQPYNANNALLLNAASTLGSMTLSSPQSVSSLALAVATGVGPTTLVPTIHFSDSTPDYLAPALTEEDWLHVTPQMVTTGGGRVTTIEYTDFFGVHHVAGEFQVFDFTAPNLVIQTVTLPANLVSHPVAGVSFNLTMTTPAAAPYGSNTAIFGISGSTDSGVTYSPLNLTPSSFTKDVVVEAAAVPEPTMDVVLGVLAVGLLVVRRRI